MGNIQKILKYLLMVVSIVGVIAASGSVTYYFAYFRPAHDKILEEDVAAIRAAVIPAAHSLQANMQAISSASGALKEAKSIWQAFF